MAEGRARTGRESIFLGLRKSLLVIAFASALAYLVDDALLRFRIASGKAPFGTVNVRPVLAVPQKDHRTEFLVEDARDQTCVHSLFPHMGDSPCWYLGTHREPRVNL